MINTDKCRPNHPSPCLSFLVQARNVKTIGSLFFVLFLFTVAACGGGGGSSEPSIPPDNVDAPVDDGDNTAEGEGGSIPVDDGLNNQGQPLETYTVSGQLTANDVLQADADVNDPFTFASDNNTFATAQLLPNPAIVKGFVTATATGVESDRFESTADEFDVFRISAFASQSILLEIADSDQNSPGSVDLDIGLFDENGNLVESSLGIESSFEAMVVPADGDYFLAVNAYIGRSNYTLTISTEFATAAFDSQISVGNLRLDKLTLTRQPREAGNQAFVESMRQGLDGQKKGASHSAGMTLDLDRERVASLFSTQNKATSSDGDKRKSLMSMQMPGAATKKASDSLDALSMLEMIKAMNSREGEDIFLPVVYPSTLQAFNSDPVPDRFLQWNLDQIGWTEAQNQLQSISFAKRPILAVIDSGFFVGHPDLDGVLVDQRDFVPAEYDGDGFVADASDEVSVNDDPICHGFHGTHVATTAVAPQNNTGITGVAPGLALIGIKVGHSSGENCGILPGDIANAILYAAGLPNASGSVPATAADVINLSLGSNGQSPEYLDAIEKAAAEGVIIVAAAGNNGAPVRSYPAAYDNVIAVAATDFLGAHAPYSSFYPEVDISAPGGDTSTDHNGDGRADGIAAGVASINGSGFQANWTVYQGTSMASPTVAAGIALMKGIEPNLTQNDIETMLAAGSLTVDIGTPGFDNETGFGLMSLPKMIESASQFSGSVPADTATIVTSTPASLDFGASLDEITLDLVQSGNEGVSVESMTGSDTLALPDGTFPIRFAGPESANGFGVYSFVLDRGTLDAGSLSGSLTFNLSNGTSYVVPVSAVNQGIQGVADSAAVFFLIERLNSDSVFEPVEGQFYAADGVRNEIVNSPELEEGSYRIIYGTDTDNDLFICDEGELCGTLPFNNFGFDAAFSLNENISDANYLLQDIANIALTDFDGTHHSAIGPRSVNKKQILPIK